MKKKSRWIVAIGLVLALTLVLFPTQVMAEPDGAVDPDGPYYPPAASAFTVDIDIDNVAFLSTVQFKMSYDETCIDWVSATAGPDVWGMPAMVMVTATDNVGEIGIAMMDLSGLAGSGGGTFCQLEFQVVGASCCTSDLDMSSHAVFNGLFNTAGSEIPSTWGDGFVEVDGPCAIEPCAPPPTVVSGIAVVGAPGSAEPGAWVPAGYEPCDEFKPCEMLCVWGEGDPCHFCQWYTIWIQPYEEGLHVAPGDAILTDPVDLPPGFVPVDVHIGEDGKFGPIELWHVDGEYCELWEIVADKTDAGNPGFYDAEWDGLDAACVGEWGFHIYPEGLTIILVSLGLLAVGGYILVVRRRRGAETDLDL